MMNTMYHIIGEFTCCVCGKKKREPPMSIGDLDNVCIECVRKGIAWAIKKAKQEEND